MSFSDILFSPFSNTDQKTPFFLPFNFRNQSHRGNTSNLKSEVPVNHVRFQIGHQYNHVRFRIRRLDFPEYQKKRDIGYPRTTISRTSSSTPVTRSGFRVRVNAPLLAAHTFGFSTTKDAMHRQLQVSHERLRVRERTT